MIESARILVVDDEKIIRDGCARILTKAGHVVESAVNGQEALDRLRHGHFHIVLLDIKMPEMDGMEVLDRLRAEQSDVLVLVITGYASIETAVEAMKAGAYDLLIKPFSADALRIAVNRALDHLSLAQAMEQLRLEQARSLRDIADEQSRIRTIMNAMACGILVTDLETNLVLFNPMAPHMLELDSSSVQGRPAAEALPQKKLVEMISQVLGGRDKAEYTALEEELQIGEHLWLRARTAPVRDSENHVMGAVTVLQDVTHMKEMDKMKNEFVAMVSHELKAPLAAIQQQITILLDGIAGEINERQAHFLARAQSRAQGLIDLINELLDLSRIEAGKIVSRQEPLDLIPIIRRVIDFLSTQAENKRQVIEVNLPESLPEISADPGNMDEVFMNVINNAIKYTPDGGRIKVSAEVAGDWVRIQVADTGYGIPKSDIPRIFDKFYRVKSDKTKSISGTGLGLPIVKGIVEAHL
ncbi:MAG: response regulator [Thermodesulfobacteriota bacterium]